MYTAPHTRNPAAFGSQTIHCAFLPLRGARSLHDYRNPTAWIRPKTGYTETALEAKGARPTYKVLFNF